MAFVPNAFQLQQWHRLSPASHPLLLSPQEDRSLDFHAHCIKPKEPIPSPSQLQLQDYTEGKSSTWCQEQIFPPPFFLFFLCPPPEYFLKHSQSTSRKRKLQLYLVSQPFEVSSHLQLEVRYGKNRPKKIKKKRKEKRLARYVT